MKSLQAGRVVQGASTLDQQLVDNLYLTGEQHDLTFKKHEACLALKLDAAWGKKRVRNLATVVWVGYPHRNVPMRNVHGIRVQGGSFPAMIWSGYMKPATARLKPRGFPSAGGVDFTPWHGAHAFTGDKAKGGQGQGGKAKGDTPAT